MIPAINRTALLLVAIVTVLALGAADCARKKETQAPAAQAPSRDLTGEWQSQIQSANRVITKSLYRIDQRDDSLSLELVSTKSPAGDELVPQAMRLAGAGAWADGAMRLSLTSWVSGKDTCTFQVKGDMDSAGNLYLHFPGDLCGDKSLPYTRTLTRIDSAIAR